MKNDVLVPPQAEDIEPYDSDRSVVRLFDKDGNWHAGIVCHIILENGECTVYVRKAIRFSHPTKRDPLDPTDTLITEHDAPISGSLREAIAFVFKNPLKMDDKGKSGVLVIKSDDAEVILSLRKQDAQSVKSLLEYKPRECQ
jgi:hypothetical protein